MNENNNMTAERSLEIINQMVEQTRWLIKNETWRSSLYYGIACTLIAIAVYFVWHATGSAGANGLWGILGILYLLPPFKFKKKGQTNNYNLLNRNIHSVWGCIGITCGFLGLAFVGLNIYLEHASATIPIIYALQAFEMQALVSIIILLCGLGTMITGYIARIKIITVCGFITGIAGFVFNLFVQDEEMMLVLTGNFAVLLVVPALLIRREVRKCSSH
jgi:hypothetical protein